MPRVIVTADAAARMKHCRQFLQAKAPAAARRAGQAIEHQLLLLESAPEIGRPLSDQPELRELVIPFGESGYVALYRYVPVEGVAYVLAFRHQKEAGCSDRLTR